MAGNSFSYMNQVCASYCVVPENYWHANGTGGGRTQEILRLIALQRGPIELFGASAETNIKRRSLTLTDALIVGTARHGRCGWCVNNIGCHHPRNHAPPDNPPTRLMHPTSHHSTRLGTRDCVFEQDGTQSTPKNTTTRCNN